MVVLSVTNCPLQLRGDLTKWLIEIDSGIYVGKLNARVREKVWKRVCENIKVGQAILVYSANNEQGFNILTYNTDWTPFDYEGLVLMHKSKSEKCKDYKDIEEKLPKGFSKAAKYEMIKKRMHMVDTEYVFLDLETTGLDAISDRILEVGMIRQKGAELEEFHEYIDVEREIPIEITKLTGIGKEVISNKGKSEKIVLEEMKEFIGNALVLGYNVKFDVEFIDKSCERNEIDPFIRKSKDVMMLAKKRLLLDNYRLETVSKYYGLSTDNMHRALEDCRLTKRIFDELNKK